MAPFGSCLGTAPQTLVRSLNGSPASRPGCRPPRSPPAALLRTAPAARPFCACPGPRAGRSSLAPRRETGSRPLPAEPPGAGPHRLRPPAVAQLRFLWAVADHAASQPRLISLRSPVLSACGLPCTPMPVWPSSPHCIKASQAVAVPTPFAAIPAIARLSKPAPPFGSLALVSWLRSRIPPF